MYDYWYHAAALRGRPAVMFAFKRSRIADPELSKHFGTLGDPLERVVTKDGKAAGTFYYRVGYEFKGSGARQTAIGVVLPTRADLAEPKDLSRSSGRRSRRKGRTRRSNRNSEKVTLDQPVFLRWRCRG